MIVLTIEFGILPDLQEQVHVFRLEKKLIPVQAKFLVHGVVEKRRHRVRDWEAEQVAMTFNA